MDKQVSAYLVKLRREHPFLATLSLYMDYRFTERVERFEADGRVARINPRFFAELNVDEQMGTLLHTTLHCALMHTVRRGSRIPEIWNIAADIVVNEVILGTSFKVPPDTAVEPRYAEMSVEQVYVKLLNSAARLTAPKPGPEETGSSGEQQDAESPGSGGCNDEGDAREEPRQSRLVSALQTIYPATPDVCEGRGQDKPGERARQKNLEGYWRRAMTRAQTVEKMSARNQGDAPAGLELEIDQVVNPQLDWRVLLWRFMARTPCDFTGFDRRFVHSGLYLDHLEGDSLTVHIAMDTSGSIDDYELSQFRAEIESIVRCYAHIDAKLYFVDAEVYGPYPLSHDAHITRAIGGGGTSFAVFFEHIEADLDPFAPTLCIYFTDGYGDFPEQPPAVPVLWVVTDEASDEYPFGEVARFAY